MSLLIQVLVGLVICYFIIGALEVVNVKRITWRQVPAWPVHYFRDLMKEM